MSLNSRIAQAQAAREAATVRADEQRQADAGTTSQLQVNANSSMSAQIAQIAAANGMTVAQVEAALASK
jgi:hypothetical protein